MSDPQPDAQSVRERVRAAVKTELADAAARAFEQDGFDATTVDAIVDRVGVSRRTFFRYFASKEDVLLQPLEELGVEIAAELASRPASEPPRVALRHALQVLVGNYAANEARWRTVMTLMLATRSLRARHVQKQDEWLDLMAPVLAARMGADADDPRPRLYCSTLLSASDAGIRSWFAGQTTGQLSDAIDAAIASLSELFNEPDSATR